ncbi:MAG: class I tRNA ligase family protein [Saprospiraceae bacterium]
MSSIHFTGTKIPVWISEYVLKDYGTGAIMAVPADDERDERFATKFGLEIIPIVDKSGHPGATMEDKVGKMINSEFLNGMEVMDAIQEILKRIEEKGIGTRKVNYKLRDAIYSRQRYWGEPFPITYDKEGISHPMKLEELPLDLPELTDFKPASGAKSPLARATDWVNLPNGYTRETDTMPGFAGSSWYFLRYMDPQNEDAFAGQDALDYWRDVDLYIGGTEHAVGHLLYSRFWHKFLYDKGLVPTNEPFKKLVNQGMIQGVIENMYMLKEKTDGVNHFVCSKVVKERNLEDSVQIPVHVDFVKDYGSQNSWIDVKGLKKFIEWRPEYKDALFECGKGIYKGGQLIADEVNNDFGLVTHSEVGKMSKSKYNVINPDEVVNQYGADTFRMYEMFLGPIEQSKPWDTQGISGVSNFLKKFWGLFFDQDGNFKVSDEQATKEELKVLHSTIKRVVDDIERFSFNTCVSHFMKAVNEFKSMNCTNRLVLEQFTVLLAPFAPFITEEVWSHFGYKDSVHKSVYPVLNEAYLKEDNIKYPVAINGKTRAFLTYPADASKADIEKAVVLKQKKCKNGWKVLLFEKSSSYQEG